MLLQIPDVLDAETLRRARDLLAGAAWAEGRRTAGPQAGTIVTRNNLVGDSIHRMDLRVMQRVPLRGRMAVDGIVELFNLFNRANYGAYTTAESNPNYGKPVQNVGLAYQPRMLQLGFRFMF